MTMNQHRTAWNKGKLIGQKPPLRIKGIWRIRTNLERQVIERWLSLYTKNNLARRFLNDDPLCDAELHVLDELTE